MNVTGELALTIAILLAATALAACFAAARFDSVRILRVAQWSLFADAAALVTACGVLLFALVNQRFEFTYVAKFTDRALPLGYKLAAFWAGQQGSLLLWAVLLAVMSTLAAFTLRSTSVAQSAASIGTLALVCAFFGLLLLVAADPFTLSAKIPADGDGLNPMLQDPAMIAHPPILFLGYAGFTVPFALMIGALLAGIRDDRWIDSARAWALVSYLALSGGILLGAKWAYVELGWGGYWAWDPVENASLLPWLTALACLHSLIIQRQREMFRVWSAALLLITFILCIFGTYITRSGIVDSVHGFGQSLVGTFFLALMIFVSVAGVAVIFWRRSLLRSSREMTGLINREGAFLAANILLLTMTLVVLVGTMFPVISGWLGGTRTTLQPHFYNHVAGPIGMLVAALMATGPLLTYGQLAARHLVRGLIAPAALAIITAFAVYFSGIHNVWAIACAVIAAVAIATVAMDVFHHRHTVLSNHRRYGAQLSHLGLIMVIVGITGSSLFSSKQDYQLNPGDSVAFSGLTLKLDTLTQNVDANCTTVSAAIIATGPDGRVISLNPKRRFFQKWDDQPNSVVAIDSTWTRDLYVSLAGWDENGNHVALEAIVNPLVSWLWVGGCTLILGGLICLTPRLQTAAAAVPQPAALGIGTRQAQLGRLS